MDTIPVKINVPVAHCEPSPFIALPYTSDSRIKLLHTAIANNGFIPAPEGFIEGDRFIVIKHWDYVRAAQQLNISTIDLLIGAFTLSEKLRMSIVDHVQEMKLPWISLSRAIRKVKLDLNLKDGELSQQLNLSRTMISRHNVIAETLHLGFQAMAEKGDLTFNLARQLVTLPIAKQLELLTQAQAKGWQSRDLQQYAFTVSSAKSAIVDQPTSSQFSKYKHDKSIEVKRAETTISEKVGYPAVIHESMEGQGGAIEYAFYDEMGMIDVMTKIRKAFERGVVPKGTITINFKSSNELNRLTQGFFDENY